MPEPQAQQQPEFVLDSEDVHLGPGRPLTVIRREPQIPYPLHTHTFAELVIITAGTGMHRVEDLLVPITAGDVFVILGDRAHGYEELDQLHLVNIPFDPALLNAPRWDLGQLPGFHAMFTLEPRWRAQGESEGHLRLDAGRLDRVLQLVSRIESELRAGEAGHGYMAANDFLRIVGELSRWYSGASHPGARRLGRIGSALGYLEDHLTSDVRLDKLVTLSGLSVSSLNRAFNRAVGLSPAAYHIRLRMRRGAELLRTTDLTVTEIADRCGYDDTNYFSRLFRKTMGVSPREYRRGGV